MSHQSFAIIVGVAILAAAVPYVARIRHPEQKLFAAWLIFVFSFGAAAFILFGVMSWLAVQLNMGATLDNPAAAALFLLLVFAPAVALGTWQARKPPWRQAPPD